MSGHATTHDDLMDLASRSSYKNGLAVGAREFVNGKWFVVKDVKTDEVTGLTAFTFENKRTGEITVGFQGTDLESTADMATDALLLTSVTPPQYAAAERYVQEMAAKHGSVSSVCGNSLGGGMAAYVAARNPQIKAVTVNPAPVPKAYAKAGASPGNPRRAGSVARAVGGVMAVGLVVLGGCVPGVGGSREKERPVVALVTPKEKDKLGWENPEAMLNSDLQRLAMENRQQIYSIVKPYVERRLGREVEMTGISARYPYQAVNVKYRTVSEPFVAGYEFVGLEDDGTLASEAQIDPDPSISVERETVSGLYLMAYRDRVTGMRQRISESHQHFTRLPDGYLHARNIADPMFKIFFHGTGPVESPRVEAATEAIYLAYVQQPHRTDEEWRALFEAHDPGFGVQIVVNVMLREPRADLTQEMTRVLAEDVRASPILVGGTSWLINAYSGRLMSADMYFHESWSFRADPNMAIFPRWSIDHWVDGATRESFVDGDPR